MSHAKPDALYMTKDSETNSSTLCNPCLERYIYISYWCFGKPSLAHCIIVYLDVPALFVYIYISNLYHCVLSVQFEATCSKQSTGGIYHHPSKTPRNGTCLCCWHLKTEWVNFTFLYHVYFIPACQQHSHISDKTFI